MCGFRDDEVCCTTPHRYLTCSGEYKARHYPECLSTFPITWYEQCAGADNYTGQRGRKRKNKRNILLAQTLFRLIPALPERIRTLIHGSRRANDPFLQSSRTALLTYSLILWLVHYIQDVYK